MEHKYKQLVLFPHILIATEPEVYEAQSPVEPYEVVTQQQLSRVVALILMITFGIFLVGYTVGKSTHSRTYDSLAPSELYSILFPQEVKPSLYETEGREYARVASLQEAVTLSSKLKDSEIVTRTSCSVSGKEKKWYQVVLLEKGYTDDR